MNSPQRTARRQITLRIPAEVDKKLTETAKKMGVSKNAYILMVLNASSSTETNKTGTEG